MFFLSCCGSRPAWPTA